jgi:hypothetical protein
VVEAGVGDARVISRRPCPRLDFVGPLPNPGESRFLSGLAPLRNDNLVGEMTKPALIIGTEGETPRDSRGTLALLYVGATLLFPLLLRFLRFAF